MKSILKQSIVVFARLTNSIIKSKVFDLTFYSLGINRGNHVCREDFSTYTSRNLFKIAKRHNVNTSIKSKRSTCNRLVVPLFASFIITNVNATSIVETFKELNPEFHQEYKSDLYEVWVKPIHPGQEFTELDGDPKLEEIFKPWTKGFKKSFTYKSINDITSDGTDTNTKCFQYYYNHPDPTLVSEDESIEKKHRDAKFDANPIQFRSESIPDNNNNHCDVSENRKKLYNNAYNVMTHTNNWTSFDVGNDTDSNVGAVRIYIQLNSQHKYSGKDIKYDIRPKHAVTAAKNIILGENYKYIKVQISGEEYVKTGSITRLKKVLVIDVLQPIGTKWSGLFNIGFNDTATTKDNKSAPYLHKHPLFIFANPLPKWYFNLANRSEYNGCPDPNQNLGLPNNFYTPEGWKPGMVVETKTFLDKDGVLNDEIDSSTVRQVNDFILKKYSKRLCIPGGVYVKGRIIHNNRYHTNHGLKLKSNHPNLSPGDSGNYNPAYQRFNNAKGVKIVGRGILSGIHMKYRSDPIYREIVTENNQCKFKPKAGAGWNGHLIDIRHQGDPYYTTNQQDEKDYYTSAVVQKNGKELDCYYRNGFEDGEDVNCVQGITLVDAPKASIYTAGSRMDVENVKIMSWHIQSNGIGSAQGSKIKNVFIKANDDSIVMGKSDMEIDNATVWRQQWGSVVNLSWKLNETINGSRLDGLNVIRFDKGQTTHSNGNAAIVSSRNMMGGTIQNFAFSNIIVEDAPYEIINLQLNDTRTYYYKKRTPKQNIEDGTGKISGLTFDGIFTPEPYKVKVDDEASASKIQKSVLGIYDGDYFPNCTKKCDQKCDGKNKQQRCYESCKLNPELNIPSENICPTDRSLSDHDVGCECPKNYKLTISQNENQQQVMQCLLIQRSISGLKLNNMCIGNKNKNTGITDNSIDDYFEFRKGVNTDPNSLEYERENPYMGNETAEITGFNDIREAGDTENSTHLCASLNPENMCTLENYRNSCQASN